MTVSSLDFRNGDELKKWDEFVFNRSQLYHHSRWAEIISSVYGFKPSFLYSEKAGQVQSVFPLFRVKVPLFRDELVSIPHLESGGMINTIFYPEYFDYIRRHISARKMKIYQYREQIGSLPSNSDDVVLLKELPEKKELIIPGMKAATARNYTRRVLERDLQVVVENNEAVLGEFYKIYLQRMREFGTPPHGFGYIKKISETFAEDAKIMLIKDSGEVVGASFYIMFNKYLYNLYLAVPQRHLKEKIVYLIQYKAMEMGIDRNLECLVLGRSTKDSGTFFFKTELGGYPIPLYLYHFRLTPEGCESVQEKSVKEKYSSAARIWTKLPSLITDHAGPFIRKWVY
ncbi:MAG: GNAT family N-acetyltransferase [Thermodesulfovibrionales bacterium]|jgi:hypothetical protein